MSSGLQNGAKQNWMGYPDKTAQSPAKRRFGLVECSTKGWDYLVHTKDDKAIHVISHNRPSRDGGFGVFDYEWAGLLLMASRHAKAFLMVECRSEHCWYVFDVEGENKTFARKIEKFDGWRMVSTWKNPNNPVVYFNASDGVKIKK